MYSINSLMGSNSSSSSSSSKAIGGLASGLDTAELIKGMTSATRLKIAKQKQNKQLLTWQTESHRAISNKLIEFSKKYTSFASTTNLASNSFFTKSDVTASGTNSSKVTVSGTSNMTDSISIVSATKASSGGAISTKDASDKILDGSNINFNSSTASTIGGETITINYNGADYKLTFDGSKYADNAAFAADMNKKLSEATINGSTDKLSSVVKFSADGTKLNMSTVTSGQEFSVTEFSSKLKTAFGFETTQFSDSKLTISNETGVSGNLDTGAFTESVDFVTALTNKPIVLSFNSTSKSISFTKEELETIRTKQPDDSYVYDKSKFAALFQTKLDSAFGKDAVKAEFNGDALKFTTSNTGAVFKIAQIDSSAQGVLGLKAGDSNRLNPTTTTLSNYGIAATVPPTDPDPNFKLSIGGTEITGLNSSSSVQQIMDAINSKTGDTGVSVSYIESLDRFEFKSTSSAAVTISGNVADQVFKANPGDTLSVVAPTKAQIKVKYGDGAAIELTSNNDTFNIDGLSINVNESFAELSGDVKLSAKTDTEKVVSTIKDMVKDYNDIISVVNKEYSTRPNRNYPPLTDEQKKDMSESEIKAWEEKAKTGMLFGDNDISSLSGDLRFVFFSSKESVAALNSIGINTSNDWKENGKIIIDEDKLKKAIASDPENVKNIFTAPLENKKDTSGSDILVDGEAIKDNTTGGLMSRLKFITDKYAKTEGATKGILIEKAGNIAAPLSITKNKLLDSMNNLDKMITNLNRMLATEEKRYQKQFSNLETVYAKLNAQSGWLSQQ